MLNFRNTNIFFAIILAIVFVIDIYADVHWLYYLLLIILYSFKLFYGSYFVQSQFYIKAICHAVTNEKKIAITFDDGPMQNYTPQILDILKRYNIRATFFCIGKHAEKNIALLQKIAADGHSIGNHSYSHGFWFDLLSAKKMKADLQQMHDVIKNILGVDMVFFRPPYGVTNPNVKKAVQQMHYITIGWSVRSMDTVIKDSDVLLPKLKARLKPGAIFLFHDTSAATMQALPAFLDYICSEGYTVEPLPLLINSDSAIKN